MNSQDVIIIPDEQKICVSCGFCCDATLFTHAVLNPGERGQLPEKMEVNSYSTSEGEYFRMPCQYFAGKCTIYDKQRADVCGSYRCQLLSDFAEKKVTLQAAIGIVCEAMSMRTVIIEEYRSISDGNSNENFRQIQIELGKFHKSVTVKAPLRIDYELLQAKCNIFEALLIKYFRSASHFEKMIMK